MLARLRPRVVVGQLARQHAASARAPLLLRYASNTAGVPTAAASSVSGSVAPVSGTNAPAVLTAEELAAMNAQSAPPAAAPIAAGPPTLEQAASNAPVPVLVGPAPNPSIFETAGAAKDMTLSEMTAAAAAAAKPDTAGGFFFAKPMAAVEFLLTSVHDIGLPWWAAIGVTTLGMRAALIPLQIFQSKSVAKLALIKPQTQELSARMREAAQRMDERGQEEAEKCRKQLSLLFEKHNVKPWMTAVGALGQLPLWVTFFFTLRHVARPGAGLGMEEGGALWFQDLTVPDPYYALPALCGASFYGMITLGDPGQAQGGDMDPQQQQMKTFMKFAAVGMPLMTYWMPSGVFVYWISTNAIGVTQTIILRQPPVRALVGMPPLPTGTSPAGLLGMSAADATANTPVVPNTALSAQGSRPVVPVPASKPAPKKQKRRRR